MLKIDFSFNKQGSLLILHIILFGVYSISVESHLKACRSHFDFNY